MASTYDFNGREYEKASTHQTSWGGSIVDQLPLRGDESILDVGCGDGRVTEQLASRVPNGRVVGIDASQGMIDSAKPRESANLHFELVDATSMQFANEFDVIFSHAALHWGHNHEQLLKCVYQALRPGGYAKLNFAGHGTCPALIEVLKATMRQAPYQQYFKEFNWPWYMPSLDEYRQVVAQSPFQDVDVQLEPKERLFPAAEPLIKWIDQPCLVPFLEPIAESDKQSFRDTVVEQMLKITRQVDGGFLEQFTRIDLLARK